MKDYAVLDDLIPKTQELHRAIFDKGYEQGKADVLNKINAEIKETANKIRNIRDDNLCFFTEQDVLEIIEKYRKVSE